MVTNFEKLFVEKLFKSIESWMKRIIGGIASLEVLTANDYDIITLDLGKERINELVAENVVSFTILDITPGATAQIVLFDVTRTPIHVPDDLMPGEEIHGLRKARIYVSNRKQPGAQLKLLVLKLR